ncbi:hypothetical protein BDY21DRAFT_164019 [Lineolata rhizophorae]|uniref:Uncharacterized protein n=1 Tax=Lineolata rhizophorae TaxID=578093 RepID=A0A6A6P8W8_9PEZI|nr:hypothetical protein BDY21DRAFT_164019 [Lineolata rhizophorae]
MSYPSTPIIPYLAPSSSKALFFSRLGWRQDDDWARELYREMKYEAVKGRARTSQNPDNLNPHARADPNVQPPYSSNQISETAMHSEIMNIFVLSQGRVREWFERGHYQNGPTQDNWIIRWLLWHVFRYRDNRNRRRSRSGSVMTGSEVDLDVGGPAVNNNAAGTGSSNTYYDPVRDA